MDTILVHAREVLRLAIMASAAALIVVHNHPNGDPTPSEAGIKVTRDFIRAGQLLKIDVLNHIIIGETSHSSLEETGLFAGPSMALRRVMQITAYSAGKTLRRR
jgi:DNA repair protein RadC